MEGRFVARRFGSGYKGFQPPPRELKTENRTTHHAIY